MGLPLVLEQVVWISLVCFILTLRRSHAAGLRTAEHHIGMRKIHTHVLRNALQAQRLLAYLTAVFLFPLQPFCDFLHPHSWVARRC